MFAEKIINILLKIFNLLINMSFPLESFKLESSKDVGYQINLLCAQKLNELNNASIEVKKESFENCQIKMNNMMRLLSNSNH